MLRPPTKLRLDVAQARRLAVSGQRLGRPPSKVGAETVLQVVREIGYLQRDPLAVVAPSHLLVLWSRLGEFDRSVLDQALWEERTLFEYWAHGASIVPTSDFAVHRWSMLRYGRGDTVWDRRLREWIQANRSLRHQILTRLASEGPLSAGAFEGAKTVRWRSSGWTEGRDIDQMLFHLWREGRVVVAGRDGRRRRWTLTELWLDRREAAPPASPRRLAEQVAERSLRALGVATELQIRDYMGAGRYDRLDGVVERLVRRGTVVPAQLEGPSGSLPGSWYLHRDDLPVAEDSGGPAQPQGATLLSPFDNLISLRRRTQLLFDFDFKMEVYVPPRLRRYGYYVLPILHRERLIGRIDLRRQRGPARLLAVAVHAEPAAPDSVEVGMAIRGALEKLAGFLGVGEVEVGQLALTPRSWRRPLRG
jgi:uncharacterized protein YcaQ